MASGDIYEVVDVQSMYGQEVQNVYFYEQRAAFIPAGGTTAQALADEWVDTILPDVQAVQSNDLQHIEVRVRNLFDDTDQGVAIAAATGGAATESLSSFNAWGFTMNTDNAAIRPGAKRIAGIPESAQSDGVATGEIITYLNALGDTLAQPITGGLIVEDDIMFPVVVQRVRSGSAGNYEYRLPETSAEAVVGTVIETLVKLIVTSQVSRKIGAGI